MRGSVRIGHVLLVSVALVLGVGAGPDPFQHGQELFSVGKYAEALVQFTTANDHQPQHPVIESWIGATLINLGKPAEAEKWLRDSIEHYRGESDKPEFHYYMLLAQSQINQEHWKDVQATLEQYEREAGEVDPAIRPQIERLRGEVVAKALAKARQQLKDSNPAAALDEVALIEPLAPNDPKLLEIRTVAYMNRGAKAEAEADQAAMYAAAAAAARAWSAADPQAKTAPVLLGRALLAGREYAEAERVFGSVVAQAPDDCASRLEIVRARIGLEQWAEAKQAATAAIECAPADSTQAWYYRCIMSAKLQQRDETIADCEQYLARADADPEKLTKVGIDVAQLKASKKSEEDARAAKAEYERRMAEWAQQGTKQPDKKQ